MYQEKYEAASDEELVLWYRQGERQAADFIINKYKKLILKKAGSMYLLGGDRDDLIQEGMLGIFKAVRDYDYDKNVNFFTFADLCISRQMYTAVQASNRKKHIPLNTYVSLYGHFLGEEEGKEGEEGRKGRKEKKKGREEGREGKKRETSGVREPKSYL